MEEDYNKDEPMEKRYLEIGHYGLAYRESMRTRDNVNYKDGHKITAKRSKDDRPQNYISMKKVKILTKRRTIKKNKLKGLDSIL